MATEDVTFTFNPMPFQKGIEQVNKGLNSMEKTAGNVAQGVSKGISRMATKVMGLAGAFLSVRGAIRSMPEIGQTFQMAGEVIKRNLLWPLRKTLMPVLQGLLDWVRDHRATFAEWGQHLVGVLRGAWEIAKVFWGALKGVANVLREMMGRAIPAMNRSISDTMNILQFKMVLVAKILEDVFQRVATFWKDSGLLDLWERMFDIVSDIVDASARMVKAFGEGFASRFKDITDAAERLYDAMDSLLTAIFGGGDGSGLEKATELFRKFGNVAGGVVAAGVETLAAVIETLAENIKSMKDAIGDGKWMRLLEEIPFFGAFAEAGRITGEKGGGFGEFVGESGRALYKRTLIDELAEILGGLLGGGNSTEVDDALIRPGREVVKFNPNDTIIATQTPGAFGGNVSVSVDMSGTQMTVTEGNAEAAGENFGYGLGQRIRDMILSDLTERGQ